MYKKTLQPTSACDLQNPVCLTTLVSRGKDADGALGQDLTAATGANSCSLYTSCFKHVARGPRAGHRILTCGPPQGLSLDGAIFPEQELKSCCCRLTVKNMRPHAIVWVRKATGF